MIRRILPFVLIGALCVSTHASGPDRPNVLLILADDLGFSDLGCYGGEIETPHLDRLARGGARFTSFYNSARCCPSRASLLTGLHPHQAGVGSFTTHEPRKGYGRAYAGHLLDDCATLAERLGDAGYSTWMVGKWHLGTPGPIERGFQNYYGFRDLFAYSADQWQASAYTRLPEHQPEELDFEGFYATDAFAAYALEFLRQARTREDKPWFLYVAHSSPHFPVQAPKASIDRHVATYRRGWDVLREERLERMKALGLIPADTPLPPRSLVPIDRDDLTQGYGGKENPAWEDLPADRREDLARRMATFAAMVEHVDRGVGRLVEDLERNGELDNTLILFLSDNGACYEWGPFGFDGPSRSKTPTSTTEDAIERIGQAGTWQAYGSAWAMLGNTPLNLYKHFCHEGGISSPLIAHWPGQIAPHADWIEEPTHLIDVVPTVLDAAKVTYAKQSAHTLQPLEGISLLPAMRGDALPERTLAFEHQLARAVRRGRYKAVWGKRMPKAPAWELYDMIDDRAEQHDLAAERPELTAELASAWESWAKRVGAEPFQRDDLESAEGRDRTPQIANRSLRIECRFDTGQHDDANGVLVAQGGREHGFALHLIDGQPAFDVRRSSKVTRILAKERVRGEVTLIATLDAKHMRIARGERVLVEANSPGLVTTQPKDPLDRGRDTLTAAGDYEAPNAFDGRVLDVRVTANDATRQTERLP